MKYYAEVTIYWVFSVLLISVGALDPNVNETCPGGPPGIEPGMVTSSAVEALGIDNVERCLDSKFSTNIITDIEWRCETRHCCREPCDCSLENVQESPCPTGTEVAQLRCLVQNKRPMPRFHEWICCNGYVEHPDTHQCLITCDKNNGDCHQVCSPSDMAPYNAECSCYPGHVMDEADPRYCNDHDECMTENGGCSDFCNNTIGSYTCSCKEGRTFVKGSVLKCIDVVIPVANPSAQESSENSPTLFIIIAIVGGVILLAILILLLVFLCRRKKKAEAEPYHGTAFTNATYGDLEGRGARASVAEYGDTEVDKKKVPIEGAVGVDNPSYEGEKKALEASGGGGGYAVPNHYEEIPYARGPKGRSLDNPSYVTDSNDGYERPLGVAEKKMSLPGAVDEPAYVNGGNGARPKQGGMVAPPDYSEIPTPGEVVADPRPPTYTSIGRKPTRFRDFQDVKYDNTSNEVLDHHVDIKDIDVEDKH